MFYISNSKVIHNSLGKMSSFKKKKWTGNKIQKILQWVYSFIHGHLFYYGPLNFKF
jgi:hypothetical protein